MQDLSNSRSIPRRLVNPVWYSTELMPSALESLAAFTQDPALASHSASRMEALRLHIADTLGMMLQGALLARAGQPWRWVLVWRAGALALA